MAIRLRTSVVITTHNSGRTLAQCLDRLEHYRASGAIADVIVVDSNSKDATRDIVASRPVTLLLEEKTEAYRDSAVRVFHSTYNALDQGWRRSVGDLVMFLDSDAYLGEGMFPVAAEYFIDPKMAVLGCWQKIAGDSRYARTMAQFFEFQGERVRAMQEKLTFWRRLYGYASWFGSERPPIGGPCYIVRRDCLEQLGGHGSFGDVGIASRLWELGWKTVWWVDAPVYHLPRQTLGGLAKERYSWGFRGQVGAAGMHKKRQFLSPPATLAWSVLVSIILSLRYRNPMHLVVHPVGTLAHVWGAVVGRVSRWQGVR